MEEGEIESPVRSMLLQKQDDEREANRLEEMILPPDIVTDHVGDLNIVVHVRPDRLIQWNAEEKLAKPQNKAENEHSPHY